MKKPSNLWRYVFFVFLFILLYQFHSSWDQNSSFSNSSENVPSDSVVFLTIKESHYGASKRGFSSLLTSLNMWEHDEKNKTVDFKFQSYLPKNNSKVMFVYDRGFTTFEKYVDVVSVATFPYQYKFQNKPLIEIHHVDKNGNLYFLYKGRKIQLKPGQSYQTFGITDFRLTKTKIENHGFYKKNHFSVNTEGFFQKTINNHSFQVKIGNEYKVINFSDKDQSSVKKLKKGNKVQFKYQIDTNGLYVLKSGIAKK